MNVCIDNCGIVIHNEMIHIWQIREQKRRITHVSIWTIHRIVP